MALALLIVFVSAKLLGEVFERLRQPGIVGEILAGMLIGPHVLGWVAPNEVLATLAEMGVMFLLFRVGLEIKASELTALGRRSTSIALAGVLLPFVAGWGFCLWWGLSNVESLFVGAALVATSVGITAQVLAAGGWLHEVASRLILGAAVIDDILGLLVLAVVSGMARGDFRITDLAVTAGLAIGFTLLVLLAGSRLMRGLVPRIRNRAYAAEAEFSFSVGLMLALAVMAQYAGVAAIIGAFLAGVAVSEAVEERVHHLTSGVSELLVPFFLVGVGMELDPAAMSTSGWFALIVIVLAALTKLLGCGLAALPLGRTDALRVGIGMIPRGEVGMVVAKIGLGFGVAQSVYATIVLVSLATTMVAPPLLRWAFRHAAADSEIGPDSLRIG
jgi:Kef-type K+ transport system membrane component KefB